MRENCTWWIYVARSSTTKYTCRLRFSKRARGRYRVAAVYNAEWKGSFRAICAEGNREFYCCQGSLYLLQASAAGSLDTPLWKTNDISARGSTVFRVLFFKSIPERHGAFTGTKWTGVSTLNHLRFIGRPRVPSAARNVSEKKYNGRHGETGNPLNWILELN